MGFVLGVAVGLIVGWLFIPAPSVVVDFWTKLKSKISG